MPRVIPLPIFQEQADAVAAAGANPVSLTLYTVLDTTKNVRIISIQSQLTWAGTAPTEMRVTVTIDGITMIFRTSNPANATAYYARFTPNTAADNQLSDATDYGMGRAFLIEGRSVKIQVAYTGAAVTPTAIDCRVKWAKIP